MTIEWNKVTWYSKLIAVILFVATFYIGFNLGKEDEAINTLPVTPPVNVVNNTNGWKTFSDAVNKFSIQYPTDFTVNKDYTYSEFGPGKDISGVRFTIPASLATGTNLGSDSYVSVEDVPQAQSCTANLFLDQGTEKTVTDNGVTYSFISSTGAGAGNRYEETVYALPNTHPCIALRYFIHYSVFENYPAGSITPFDQQALLNKFDAIRHTLIVNQ